MSWKHVCRRQIDGEQTLGPVGGQEGRDSMRDAEKKEEVGKKAGLQANNAS